MSPTVHKLTNEIDKQKELNISKNSEFTIPTNLKNLSKNVLQLQTNNSFQQHLQDLKTNTQNFPSISFLQLLISLIMRQNLENTKIIISLTPVPDRTHPIGKNF